MVEATVKQQILSDLERLSPEMQARAAKLVHELVTATPRETPGRDLLRFAGTIDAQSLREMKEAIEDGCEPRHDVCPHERRTWYSYAL